MRLLYVFLLVLISCGSEPRKSDGLYIECGGPGHFGCPASMYCELDNNCGGIDQRGRCSRIPQTCPVEDSLVCACNGKEYKSKCYANASGESVAYEGHCMK